MTERLRVSRKFLRRADRCWWWVFWAAIYLNECLC